VLDLERYLDEITASADALAADADVAGTDAPVPTCPAWQVADLVAHLGMVHRWATANLTGAADPSGVATAALAEAATCDDPADWLRAGAAALVEALRSVPDDVPAMVFLRNAPQPRLFWARRQAHETTVHRIDGLSARLGRMPVASDVHLAADLAADGLDELLTGFLPRPKAKLRAEVPITVTVAPTDVDAAWTMRISADAPVTTHGSDPGSDAVFTGTAAALYLGLWNRGDEIAETGGMEAVGLWRERARITWA
jgi:uncharacterized protein (TIGR03083 family)